MRAPTDLSWEEGRWREVIEWTNVLAFTGLITGAAWLLFWRELGFGPRSCVEKPHGWFCRLTCQSAPCRSGGDSRCSPYSTECHSCQPADRDLSSLVRRTAGDGPHRHSFTWTRRCEQRHVTVDDDRLKSFWLEWIDPPLLQHRPADSPGGLRLLWVYLCIWFPHCSHAPFSMFIKDPHRFLTFFLTMDKKKFDLKIWF